MPLNVPVHPTAPRVPLVDLRTIYGEFEDELVAAFQRVLRSGHYILGPEVESFEAGAANWLGAKHCVAVSSGTDALLAALLALQIGPGDEVITSPLTFVSTAEAIVRVGATPVFADICPQCLCLDPARVAEKISSSTRAIIPVHLYGDLGHIEQLLDLARQHDLFVIEDACQAFGSQTKNARKAGTLGDIGCFSFFPTKVLGAIGDAGLICTQSALLAERLRSLRSHGRADKHRFCYLGGNFRIDALQAALLSVLLSKVDEWLTARRNVAQVYTSGLSNVRGIVTPKSCKDGLRAWSVYTIRTNRDRSRLAKQLSDNGVETGIYYPMTLAEQPVFDSRREDSESLEQAMLAAREVLSLPIYPGISSASLSRVIECIRDHAAAQGDVSYGQQPF
jgi:dTDP-4-amino-4,6-dideoxygalactose transaminase